MTDLPPHPSPALPPPAAAPAGPSARPPLSVVYLSASAAVGGAERALLDLLASLRAAEPAWRLSLVVPGEGALADAVRALGVDARVLPFPPALAALGDAGASEGGGSGALPLLLGMLRAGPGAARYLARLRALLAEMEPDLVHTNGFKMHVLGARAAPADAKVVWHLHDFVSTRRAMAGMMRRTARRVDGVIAVSRAVAVDAAAIVGAARVRTVYNAVDLDRFRLLGPAMDLDAAAGMLPAPPGTIRVGLVATMGRWKGHGVFLRAVASLPKELPVRAYVVGGGIYRTAGSEVDADDLRRTAAELGIADRVGFTGFTDDAPAAMRALDVVVHASTQPEPFGLVIAEAMACGRPVIASAAGGAGEIVTPGHDALAVDPGDVDALADAIRQLALDPVLRGRLARAGRETAVRRFDRARLAAEVAPLYRALLAPR